MLLLLLTACSRHPSDALDASQADRLIQNATVFHQGDYLYVRARLDPYLLEDSVALLKQGEVLTGLYRFQLYRIRDWLPDRQEVEVTLKHRVRLHLITGKFELQETQQGLERIQAVYYTEDPEEAFRFLSNPQPLSLGYQNSFSSNTDYRLEVLFRWESEGVARLFRRLSGWLTFWDASYAALTLFYHHHPSQGVQ